MLNRIGSILGWAGTAFVVAALALGGAPLFGIPALGKPEWVPYARYAAFTGLALILVYIATQWREVADSFGRRQTRLGTIAGSTVLVVLALLVAVNYLSSRRNKRWDLTANQQFSLSDQTRQILQKLDTPLAMKVFDRPAEFDRFRERLEEYSYLSKQVSVEYIDVDKQPVLATQNQVQSYGTVVLEYKGRTERVVSSDEQQLTNGLIKLITGQQRKVYFLQGHGEKDTANSERGGYSAINSSLQSDNFQTAPLVLAQTGSVPADATIVAIAGPTADLLPAEIDLLKQYVEKGGKLLVLVDPPREPSDTAFSNLRAFLHDWAIDLGNNVVETKGVRLSGTDESVVVAAPPYPTHAITQQFGLLTAYPLTQSVVPVTAGVNGRTAQSFVQSAALAASAGGDQSSAGVSIAATVAVPVASDAAEPNQPGAEGKAEKPPKPETRIAVVGDSDFASNALLGVDGNRDMFLNTLNWLSQQETLISIRPRDPEDRRLTLTASQQNRVGWLVLLVIPAAIWGAGIWNWSRRRG